MTLHAHRGEDGVKGVKNVVNAEYRQDSFALSAAADLNKVVISFWLALGLISSTEEGRCFGCRWL